MPHLFWRLIFSVMAGLLMHVQAHSASVLIKEVQTVRGRIQLLENERSQSFLVFADEARQLVLNSAWQNANIEHTTQIGNQTAIVLGYSDMACSSRQALLVVTPQRVWGPYQLGGCDDVLIYQRGEANDSFVVMSPSDSMAWVYTVSDERFRGPARIDLPAQLRQFSRPAIATAPVPPPVPLSPPAPAPIAIPAPATASREPGFQPRPPVTSTARPAPSTRPVSAAAPVTPSAVSTTPPARTNPIRQPKLSATDASAVTNEVTKTTRPQKQIVIDLT